MQLLIQPLIQIKPLYQGKHEHAVTGALDAAQPASNVGRTKVCVQHPTTRALTETSNTGMQTTQKFIPSTQKHKEATTHQHALEITTQETIKDIY